MVAAYENPMLRNLRVDLRRYPEIQQALKTGEVVLIQDVLTDPLYQAVRAEWEAEGIAGADPLGARAPVPAARASRWASSSSGPPPRTPPLNQQDVQFADQVIKAAVAALEKAYDLETAMDGQEHMRHLAETDPLTDTFNRRALSDKIVQEMERAERYGTVLTCLMVDIDEFKRINDEHGHLTGDRVLRSLANLLKREQRAVDVLARYGGEEFTLLLPETGPTGARIFAERIIRRVAAHDFGEAGRPVHVTISIGVATFPDERITDPESFLKLADANLYKAKADGRNRFRD